VLSFPPSLRVLQPWTSVFPRDQILFLRNEDYQAAPKEHLQAVMKFLGRCCILTVMPSASSSATLI
jgi:hypothetical protein